MAHDGSSQPKNGDPQKKALGMLRLGKAPDEVVSRLLKEGMTQAEAEALVERADDALQDELRRGTPPKAKALDGVDREWDRTQIEPQLEKGRKWIGAVAILYVLGGLMFFFLTQNTMVLVVNLVLAGIQAGLWLWAKQNLLPAAVTALVLFVTVHLASAVVDPSSLFQGIIVKVIFIVVLAQTIRTALEARALRGANA